MDRVPTTPSVSVIVPCYNAQSTVIRALQSVLGQTLAVHETIVVDDGSQDRSAEIVGRSFPSVKLVRQENKGPAAARNAGMIQAQGKYIAFLDADDLWLPQRLATQIPILEGEPGVGLVCGPTIWATGDGQYSVPQKVRVGYFTRRLRDVFANHRIRTSAVLMRRSLVEEVGLMDESLPSSQDVDYFLRIAAARWIIAYTRAPLTVGYNEPGRITADLGRLAKRRLEVVERWDPAINDASPLSARDFARAHTFGCAVAGEYAAAGGLREQARRYFRQGAGKRGGPLALRAACVVGRGYPELLELVQRLFRRATGRRPLKR